MKPFVANDLPGTRSLFLSVSEAQNALSTLVLRHCPEDEECHQWIDSLNGLADWLNNQMNEKTEVKQQQINMMSVNANLGVQYEED